QSGAAEPVEHQGGLDLAPASGAADLVVGVGFVGGGLGQELVEGEGVRAGAACVVLAGAGDQPRFDQAGIAGLDDVVESLGEHGQEPDGVGAGHAQGDGGLLASVVSQQGPGGGAGFAVVQQGTVPPVLVGGVAVLAGDEPGGDAGLAGG